MTNNKTSGNDGLSKEFYEAFWNELRDPLLKSFYYAEAGRVISDIWDISDKLSIDGYLVTVDIEKAFDSLDHGFLLVFLKKFGFGNNFIDWIKILLTNQKSCVINGGSTTSYFKLEKGAGQGDPISAYLFIIALEIIFTMIKSNPNIKGLNIFTHNYLHTAHADDTTFF